MLINHTTLKGFGNQRLGLYKTILWNLIKATVKALMKRRLCTDSVMINGIEHKITRVQILIDPISRHVNTFGKGMNPHLG